MRKTIKFGFIFGLYFIFNLARRLYKYIPFIFFTIENRKHGSLLNNHWEKTGERGVDETNGEGLLQGWERIGKV